MYRLLGQFKVPMVPEHKVRHINKLCQAPVVPAVPLKPKNLSTRGPRKRKTLSTASKSDSSNISWSPFFWNNSVRWPLFPGLEKSVFSPCPGALLKHILGTSRDLWGRCFVWFYAILNFQSDISQPNSVSGHSSACIRYILLTFSIRLMTNNA